MQLHPRGDVLYISSGGSVVNAFDVRTGIPLQSFGSTDFSSAQMRFIISPCGSLLLTSTCTEIVGWNILNGSRLSAYQLPLPHSHRKRSITSFDYHPTSNFVCVTVYGQAGDAGLFLLGYKGQEAATNIAMVVDQVRRQPQLSEAVLVPERKAKKNADNEDLAKIIKRIDDIFLLPQNRTDDVKRDQPSITGAVTAFPSRIPIPMPRGSLEMVEILSDDSSSSRSGTFTIPGRGDAGSVGSQTFSVHKMNENDGNDGTYSIQGGDDMVNSGDDTTISESL